MTPQEALEMLNNVVASVPMTRADHVRAVEAVNTLKTAIAPKPEPPASESDT